MFPPPSVGLGKRMLSQGGSGPRVQSSQVLATHTPCKFKSQQDLEVEETLQLEEEVGLACEVGKGLLRCPLPLSLGRLLHPWSPVTS